MKSEKAIISIKSKDGKYETICNITITEKTVEIESVTISGDNSVGVGNIIKLSVKFNPDNATSGKLKWESSNESIATVDENGIVKGVKAGTVTIKVTTENGKTATKNITVKEVTTSQNNNNNSKPNTSGGNTGGNTPSKPSEVLPSSVSISGENVVYVGNTIQLTATVLPNNATSKSVTWKSNDTSIASVDQTGRVTGNAAGSTTITVTTKNGKTATYQITVKEKEASYVIHLKVYTKGMEGEVLQYSYRITKNGADFSDYSSFTINGTKYLKTNSNPTMDGKVVTNGGSNTATIKLSDGSEKTLNVVFE